MSKQRVVVLCIAALAAACATPGPPPSADMLQDELALRCRNFREEPRFFALSEAHQAWINDCIQRFEALPDPEVSKARVRLALDYREDLTLSGGAVPIAWEELEAAVLPDVRALSRATGDPEALVLSARWHQHVMHERGASLALACKAARMAPALYEGQLLCGDMQRRVRRDVAAAIARWKAAYPLASTRAEQCRVVDRILEYSVEPERDQEGMSPTVVAFCRQRRAGAGVAPSASRERAAP